MRQRKNLSRFAKSKTENSLNQTLDNMSTSYRYTDENRDILKNLIQNQLDGDEFQSILSIIEREEPNQLMENDINFEFDLTNLKQSTIEMLQSFTINTLNSRAIRESTLDDNLMVDPEITLEDVKKRIEKITMASETFGEKSKRSISSSDLNQQSTIKKPLLNKVNASNKANSTKRTQTGIKLIDFSWLEQSSSTNQQQICDAYKKLRNQLCFVCGLTSSSYKVTDHLKEKYEQKFNLKVVMNEVYTPNAICGTCRANLSCSKGKRRFRFITPMIWKPYSSHISSSNCDCYFCLVQHNELFFKEKNPKHQPINSSCILPELIIAKPVKYSPPKKMNRSKPPLYKNLNFNLNSTMNMNSPLINQSMNSSLNNLNNFNNFNNLNNLNKQNLNQQLHSNQALARNLSQNLYQDQYFNQNTYQNSNQLLNSNQNLEQAQNQMDINRLLQLLNQVKSQETDQVSSINSSFSPFNEKIGSKFEESQLLILLKSLREDIYFLGEKLDNKMNMIRQEICGVKEQAISNNVNLASLIMQINKNNSESTLNQDQCKEEVSNKNVDQSSNAIKEKQMV